MEQSYVSNNRPDTVVSSDVDSLPKLKKGTVHNLAKKARVGDEFNDNELNELNGLLSTYKDPKKFNYDYEEILEDLNEVKKEEVDLEYLKIQEVEKLDQENEEIE